MQIDDEEVLNPQSPTIIPFPSRFELPITHFFGCTVSEAKEGLFVEQGKRLLDDYSDGTVDVCTDIVEQITIRSVSSSIEPLETLPNENDIIADNPPESKAPVASSGVLTSDLASFLLTHSTLIEQTSSKRFYP